MSLIYFDFYHCRSLTNRLPSCQQKAEPNYVLLILSDEQKEMTLSYPYYDVITHFKAY